MTRISTRLPHLHATAQRQTTPITLTLLATAIFLFGTALARDLFGTSGEESSIMLRAKTQSESTQN